MASEETLRQRSEIDAAVEGMTLVDVLARNVREHPDRAAVHWEEGEEWRSLTWREYRTAVGEAAAGLSTLGFGRGDFLAIQAGNRKEHAVADLAAIHAGGTAVTFYNTLAQDQVSYIARHCDAKVAVLEDLTFMKNWEAVRADLPGLEYVVLMEGGENYDTVDWVISWDELVRRGREMLATDPETVERLAAQIRPEDPATLIYTSGTTGIPKGVMFTHQQALWTTESARRALDLPQNPRLVSYLPLAHIAERMASHYMGLWLAGQVYFCPALDQVLEYITAARPQIFVGVPRVYEKFHSRLIGRFHEDPRRTRLIMAAVENGIAKVRAEQEGRSPGILTNLKAVLFDRLVFSKVRHGLGMDDVTIAVTTAAPIDSELIVFFQALGIPVCELYGLSECTGPATTNVPGANAIGSAGRPMPGVEVRLEDDGEVLIRGGNVASGYFKMPKETADTFDADGWLHTGDLGRFDENGVLWIIGRKKEIIITAAGKNIAPAKLESILKNHALIAQVCMVGDQRKYLTMLIALDAEEAPAWAAAHGIEYADLATFSRLPEVIGEVERVLEAANSHVARVEQVKRFWIVPDEWTTESGEVTPSLKLRRGVVLDRYAGDIDRLYVEA